MRKWQILSALILILAVALPSAAQKRDKNLTITVVGPSGAPVPTASVLLKQTDY